MKSTESRSLRQRAVQVPMERLVLAAFTVVMAVIVFGNDAGVFTPDTKPEMFLNPVDTMRGFASAWLDTPNLGASNYNAGVAPVTALFAAFDVVGLPAWVTMRLWRLGLILLAAFGARLVVRHLLRRDSDTPGLAVAGVAGAIAYAVNPYVVVGGGTTPTMLPYALLPWLVLCWFRGFRAPSWRWAAASALVLAAMSGINAGVVPLMQLLVLVPVVVHAVLIEGHRFLTVAGVVLRTGAIYALLSAYWLVPALAALGLGTSIAESTESTAAINTANSFTEVLRGLGMWTLYGADGNGSFDPGRLSYVTGPVVILLTFGGPVLAGLGVRLSRSPARLFGATAVLSGALIMVGTFPNSGTSAWGSAIGAALESVPGLIAFRTTNKVGAVLELGLAVLIALAARAIVPRLSTSAQRWGAAAASSAVLAGSFAPALSGDLFWVRMDVPDYWQEAAADVNERADESRVLMVPGTGVAGYSWGYEGPDEIGPSLFHRPFVFRSAWPSGGRYSANLLAGVDRRLQQGTLPAGTLSALADYIGAGDVVARYDTDGSDIDGGARVEAQLDDDTGLGPAREYGPAKVAHGASAPAVVRPVTGMDRTTSVAVRSPGGSLLVDGAGTSLASLQSAGLLQSRPALLLAGSLDDEQLAEAVRDEARVVLTDGNARREWSNTNPAGTGPLVGAAVDPGSSRALFSAADQTVARLRGNASVTTSGDGILFGPYAFGDVSQAFDGDRTTGWRFGNFGSGVGNALTLTPRSPVPLGTIQLHPMHGEFNRITEVEVTAVVDGEPHTQTVAVTPWNSFPVDVEVPTGPVSRLTIAVRGVEGIGNGPVGFSEISVPGIEMDRVAALPTRLIRRLPAAAEAAGVALVDVPIDVALSRERGETSGFGVEEPVLEREFALPDTRRYRVSGMVQLADGASDDALDALAGANDDVVATSSSRAGNASRNRASMALDDSGGEANLETAWQPGGPVVGEWIAVDFPSRRLRDFTLTQAEGGGQAVRALVSVDDGEPFEVELTAGRNRISLPTAQRAHRVRVLLTEKQGWGPVRISDLGLPRVTSTDAQADGCVPVATIDGQRIEADLDGDHAALLDGEAVPFTACGPTPTIDRGEHRVAGVATFALNDLHLSSDAEPPVLTTAPEYEVLRHDASSMDVRLTSGCFPCLVSSGQAHDDRWTATLAGRDLGSPLVVDGFAAGWRVDARPGEIVRIAFAPARTGRVAWAISGVALLACLGLLLVGPLRRVRRRQPSARDAERS
ncbi:alpha-(1-_3)-arabinofuranosyltransferase domain-containing protein [Janibacter sp. G1551]|uniref:alpha-(1->3)-arabinofuranosyltransferase domain-containing protein n=1 Tax=Janibacter sp. G1551 TaxID=3420440 RepID=UPI003CFECE0C